MKLFFKIMTICALLLGTLSCSKQENAADRPLEVSYLNLSGTWQLVELGGKPVPEDVYCYMVLERDTHEFQMYDNFSSMGAFLNTGRYNLANDPHKGDKISGKYNFGRGEWKDEFMITDLLSSGSMVWTGIKDPEFIQKFVRCDAVPEEVIKEARKNEK